MPRCDVTTFIYDRRGKKSVVTNMFNEKTRNGRLVRRMHNANYGAAAFKFIA